MNHLSSDYSSVAIDYDFPFTITSSSVNIAQMFVLPADYVRGTNDDEQRIPDISGIQILVYLPNNTMSCNWSIGYCLNNTNPTNTSQFTIVQTGSTTSNYTPGPSGVVWYEIIFSESIAVTNDLLDAYWLVQFTINNSYQIGCFAINEQGFDQRIQGFELTSTNSSSIPLDTIAELGVPGSFSFRLLSLAADSGTDFLGNQYRSIVSTSPISNIATTNNSIGGIGNYWLSPALPASDAVASLYFDMRAVSTETQYSLTNLILDPSFEYDVNSNTTNALFPSETLYPSPTLYPSDASGNFLSNWSYNITSGTLQTFNIVTGNAPYGVNMLHMVVTGVPTGDYVQITSTEMPVSVSTEYAGSVVIEINSSTAAYGIIQFDWYDATSTYISSSYSTQQVTKTSTNSTSTLTATSPVTPSVAAFARVTITVYNTAGATETLDFQIDGIYFEQVLYQITPTYFDGDTLGCAWTGQPGNSTSVQLSINDLSDAPVVVDALIFEPIFANQNYTLYYSNDDNNIESTPITTHEWESKLWTRAISVTTNFGNETQILPFPIGAKYLKIELTNPQMQQYDPGNFQLPITYKTFPSWVQNYFLSQVQYPNYDTDQVIVQSNALTTIYTPDLSDLIQQPSTPNVPSSTTYSTISGNFDNTTLGQITLNTTPYQDTLGTQGNPNTTLGAIANIQTNNTINGAQQVTEGTSSTYSPITTVSSLQRDSVLAELLAPDMYFFYTCRHAYMEKTATLTNNKAYFFGVNNITFLRSQGSVVSDTPIYTETGLDTVNSSVNDFTITSQGWWETYAAS